MQQASGHHEFGDEEHPFEVDWLYSASDAIEERPGTSSLFFTQLDFADPAIASIPGADFRPSLGTVFTFGDIFGSNPPVTESFRETLETVEESTNKRIDITIPLFDDGDDVFKVKIGGNQFDKSREVRGRFFTYNITNSFSDDLATADGGQFGIDFLDSLNGLVDQNGDPLFNGIAGGAGSRFFIEENTTDGNTVRNVNAGTKVQAAYLQGNLEFGRWEVIGGARFETEDRSFEVLANQNPAGTEIPLTTVTNDYLLPGITINRTFGDDEEFLVTGAWSRTVARPTFFEFAPVRSVDQSSGDITQGNPNLKDTLIDNFDLRWGWTPDPGTSFAISAFHKSLDSPIAQSISFNDRTFINGDKGSLQGLELELQKSFFENWSITSNFTYIDSLLEFPVQGQTLSTTFDGQPNYIFNLGLGWNDRDAGWSATLNYNLTGSFLTGVPGSTIEPPIRRDAYNQLDLIVQRKFDLGRGVGIVTFNFGNLLDSVDRELFDGTDFVVSSFKPGRSFGLKFDYKF